MVEPILLWNMSSVVAGLIFEFCNLIMPIPFLADLNRFLVTCTHARQNLDEAGGEKTRGQLFQSGSRYLKIWYLRTYIRHLTHKNHDENNLLARRLSSKPQPLTGFPQN